MRFRPNRTIALLIGLTMVSIAGSANAERYLEYRGGFFEPWKGDGDFTFALQLGNSINDRSYWGGEFEVRRFDGELFKVKDLDVISFQIRGIYRYDVIVDAVVIPYVGVGGGLAFNNYDSGEVEKGLETGTARATVPSFGIGFGFLGFAGVEYEIPNHEHWSVFGEGRIGYSAQFSRKRIDGSLKKIRVDNLGGATAHAGVRLNF